MTSLTNLLGAGLGTVRTLGIATAVAGIAVLGLASVTPAAHTASASADPAAQEVSVAGPDDFIQLDHGVAPIFFCDAEKPHKHHEKCIDVTPGGKRF